MCADKLVIDANGSVLGRLAAQTAKELLKGKSVDIVNAQGAVVTGDPKYTIGFFKAKVVRGHPYAGPFYPKSPEQIIKRVVRGMLPYKRPKGREALKRLKVYISVPENMKEKVSTLKAAHKPMKHKYITLGQISEQLGVRKVW